MKKRITIIIIILLACIIGFSEFNLNAAKKPKNNKKNEKKSRRKLIKQLAPRYRHWLDLVYHIITPMEKDIFFKLTNNRDRDAYIKLFWNLRDPSKGTPQNEFKIEHEKRFKHANRYFKYGSPLPGWKTDRGKIYILLGEPVTREEINRSGLYPIEIWDYYGGGLGLPTHFKMVFYKNHGSGDFRLYVPAEDGPAALLQSHVGQVDAQDYSTVYQEIRKLDPTVAEIALTLIPGEATHNFSPSLRGPILMSQVFELPKRKINTTYARNFLNYKGIVETSVTTNYINIKCDTYTIKDPILNMNFVHIAVRPEQVSVEYLGEQQKYYFNFNLMVLLKKGDDVVLQYNKNYPFYFSKEELNTKISHGVVITDYFPVIEGKYKFIAILRNSLNKELSYYEKMIETSPTLNVIPQIYGPMVSYGIGMTQGVVNSAFSVAGHKIKIDPKRLFGMKDNLSTFFSIGKGSYDKKFHIELEVQCEDERNSYLKKYTLEYPENKNMWQFTQSLEKLKYGSYAARVKVVGASGIVLAVKEKDFQVSPQSYIPHPPMIAKNLRSENNYLFFMTLATQYNAVKKYKLAEENFGKAFKRNAKFPPLVKNYATFLMQQQKYDKVLSIIENLKGNEEEKFHYFSYKGRALYFKKSYNAAVDALLEANKIYDSDVPVINALGLSLIQIGEIEEAAKALSASLKINGMQDEIKKILKKVEGQIQSKKNIKKATEESGKRK